MTPLEQSRIARDIAHLAPIIPVLVIEDVAHARPLAEALVRGHLPALEVTLRHPRRSTPSPPWPRCRTAWWARARC
jgi:2-dehydro-3-deoxyphosphogluconate aldolase/(4S)-4-hydroxy-2-oxoglutarate aldolase